MKRLLILAGLFVAGCNNQEMPQSTLAPPQSTSETSQSTPTETKPRFTIQQYDRLQKGMTYQEAVSIMGAEGRNAQATDLGDGNSTNIYAWENSENSFASVIFSNGRIEALHQTNLPSE